MLLSKSDVVSSFTNGKFLGISYNVFYDLSIEQS